MFRDKPFQSHSGLTLSFKIELDSLSTADWDCLAHIAHEQLGFPEWSHVVGVPEGGLKFAAALLQYCNTRGKYVLIADDVLTTGRSMVERRQSINAPTIGVVAFSRGPCPNWIKWIFQLHPEIC